MALTFGVLLRNGTRLSPRYVFSPRNSSSEAKSQQHAEEEEFRVLNLRPIKQAPMQRRKAKVQAILPPRYKRMKTDQDWGSVWPAARGFHPATVPLPLNQGFTEGGKAPPEKWANAELMKIPNFLHLTPPVIKKQVEALKKFCTPWPKGLDTEEKLDKHFPLKVITSDYCLSSPTIRNPLARIVSVKIKLSAFKFDEHARDKFLRLVKDRYNPETDEVTIVTDRCPTREQNYDYTMYVLAALCHEARNHEQWEELKSEADMERYRWQYNRSKETSEEILNWGSKEKKESPPQKYVDCVERLFNEGENDQNVKQYKLAVLELLKLKPAEPYIPVQGDESTKTTAAESK